ncbi:MAG: type I methionyl aminopeptidase [Candidatus Paceibacterota bacterium]
MAILEKIEEREILREAGRRLALILEDTIAHVRVGVTPRFLDEYAYKRIVEGGDIPAFLNYTPEGAVSPFPASLCVSVNDEVVHGIPGDTPLKESDIVSLDLGLIHKALVVDMARTIAVGRISSEEEKLISITKEALKKGIEASCVGGHIGDIGSAVEKAVAPSGFRVVSELGGHGVGRRVHEEPFVPNVGTTGTGEEIVEGMVLALEPIVTIGSPEIILHKDGYTIKTKSGSRSAHFEDTILITKEGVEIITRAH